MFNFNFIDNTIIYNNKAISVYQLFSVNLLLMSQEDQKTFFYKIQNTLNNLKDHIQINIRVRNAKIEEYSSYFSSLMNQSLLDENRLNHTKSLINEMKYLLTESEDFILSRKYYLQLSVDIKNIDENIKPYLLKLGKKGTHLSYSFSQSGLKIKRLQTKELKDYVKEFAN